MTVQAASRSPGRSPSSDQAQLWERLSILSRVIKLQRIVTWSIRLALLGLIVDCVWLAGSRVFPYTVPATVLLAVPLGLAALGALILTFWRPSTAYLARQADRRLSLKERLTTAVELQSGSDGSRPLAGLQLQDAVAHFRRVEPLEAFPVRVSAREVAATLALALVAVLLVALPNPMQQTVRQREQVQESIKQEAERLNKLADQVAAASLDDPSEDLQQVEQALREGAKALEQRSLSGEEALASLAAMEQRLAQAGGTGSLEDALSSLASSLAQEPSSRQLGNSLARGDYKQAAEEMRRLAQQTENLSAAERARLARAMRQAGQRAARSNPALGQSLGQSAQALEQGNASESQSALDNAAGQIERAEGQLRAGSERERAMSQLQQSRSSISRSIQQQQQAQNRGQSGARQAGSRPGTSPEAGEEGTGSGGQGSGDSESGSADRPGGSAAGTGSNPNPRSEEIYDPSFAGSRQEHVSSGEPFEPTESFENPYTEDPQRNDPQVNYSQVYTRYQERAVQSLENSYIPVGLKDLVKDYFSSLSPEK